MITADKVKSLNKKIEELNAKSTRAKAKVEVLEGSLEKSLEDYKTIYGVTLKGKNMAETINNIKKELGIVNSEAEKEFELRNAVVDAIERGDIEEANRLLGVEVEESEAEVPVDNEDMMAEGILETVRGESDEEVVEEVVASEEASNFNAQVSSLFGSEAEENEEPETFSFSGFNIGSIDDDDEPAPVAKKAEKPKSSKKSAGNGFSNLGGSVSDAVSELEGDSFSSFDMDESDFEDFGLGNILSGTKFQIDG